MFSNFHTYKWFRELECEEGYVEDGENCVDIDECTDPFYSDQGWALENAKIFILKIKNNDFFEFFFSKMLNPALDNCGWTTSCVNTEGSHFCECVAGFEYDRYETGYDYETKSEYPTLICKDIDECVTGRVSAKFSFFMFFLNWF